MELKEDTQAALQGKLGLLAKKNECSVFRQAFSLTYFHVSSTCGVVNAERR